MATLMGSRPWWRLMAVAMTIAASELTNTRTSQAGPAPIDRNGVLILLRTTLLALDDANKTGNYTTFRDLAAPSLAAANTAAKLGDIFASNRRDGLDLSGVAVLDPQLTVLPEIEANGMMRMSGFFPSVPKQVNFELVYQPVEGQWRLFGIRVNVGPSGPVPPAPPPAAPAKPTTKPEVKRKLVHPGNGAPLHGAHPATVAPTPTPAETPETK